MGNVDDPDETWHDVEVPEEVSIDLNIPKELRKKVATEGEPVVGARRSEVSQIDMCLNDFMMCDTVALDKKPGKFQEKDEEEGSDILFLCPELIGANHKTTDDGHGATNKNEETEELEEEIEKRTDGPGFKDMGKRDSEFHEIPGRKSFDHVHSKSCHKSKYQ